MVDDVLDRVRALLGVVNPLGWMLLAGGVLCSLLLTHTHWRELAVVAAACLLLLLLALPFLLGRTSVRVALVLDPQRVVAGQSVAAGVEVTNVAARRLLPTLLELPVGETVHRYGLPSLGAGATHTESFTVRTERRGVIAVGPATTRRGDPLSVFSRDVEWTGVTEVLVRPPMVPLESLGAGLLRDLEGVETDAVSQSDLAFHALREYVPGDDLRHVHWRSSAKATGSAGESQLLVRQYLDTRRSHATIVVDDATDAWLDPQDYETAMSVAASIAVRAVIDDVETSFVSGAQAASGIDGNLTLDAICRAVPGRTGLVAAARRAAAVAGDTSLLFLLSGPETPFESFQRAAAAFPPEVRTFPVVVDATGRTRVTEAGGMPVLHLTARDDLGPLLRWSVR
ncbi:DUF58 domain-containing protein [Nocardioides sp.]|uniref:DUF58 domain-containing protein n=1 Tax=Nocardioides sp. TaxID=35761 RepID=UPI002734AA7C|nr:DUF58 domain-containing protein [Nocardioides sp.]MDP3890859.1 DUF58 domain-containing protein [Nocardioides sp.]